MKRVLVIDDSTTILDLVKRVLEQSGIEVQTVTDAAGFDPTGVSEPDLILVDVNMPQFYGDDIVTYFREEWPIRPPIYLFSNVPERELQQRAVACGADGYISKEWGVRRLVDAVNGLLTDLAGAASTE